MRTTVCIDASSAFCTGEAGSRGGQLVAGIQLGQHLLLQVPAGRLLDRAALRRDCLLLRLTLTARSRSGRVLDDVLNLRAVRSHLYLLRGRVRVHRGKIRIAVVSNVRKTLTNARSK